jgi:hypothetical protein
MRPRWLRRLVPRHLHATGERDRDLFGERSVRLHLQFGLSPAERRLRGELHAHELRGVLRGSRLQPRGGRDVLRGERRRLPGLRLAAGKRDRDVLGLRSMWIHLQFGLSPAERRLRGGLLAQQLRGVLLGSHLQPRGRRDVLRGERRRLPDLPHGAAERDRDVLGVRSMWIHLQRG